MAISLTSDQKTSLREDPLGIFLCVDLFLDAGTQRFWDGPETTAIGGNTYVATGGYAGASAVSQIADLGASGVELSLDASALLNAAGDPTDPAYFISQIIAAGGYRQRRQEWNYSIWNGKTGVHIFQRRCFTGVIDQMVIRQAASGTARLVVRGESLTLRYGQRIGRVRNHEDQQELYPGDDFFKLCSGSIATEKNIIWGGKTASTKGSAAAGGAVGGGLIIRSQQQ